MFGKLKDKLKSALNVFSKKAEEEAEEKVTEKQDVSEEVKEEISKDIVEEKPKKEKVEEEKEEKEEPEISDKTPLEEVYEEKAHDEAIEELEEKKEEEISEQKEETAEEVIKEEKVIEKEEVKETKKEELIIEEKKKVISPNVLKITYYVHGTTKDNEEKLASGHHDVELSKKGIKESKELKDKVKNKEFAVVFTSDLKRAVDSAKLIWGDELKTIQDPRLRECNYGVLTQGTKDAFKEWEKHHDPIKEPYPTGESFTDVERRLALFLNDTYNKYKGKRIAIIAHRYPQLAIEVLTQGKSWQHACEDDWRLTKSWQPGWEYEMDGKVNVPKEETEEKKVEEKKEVLDDSTKETDASEEKAEEKKEGSQGFFGRIKSVFTKVEEVKEEDKKEAEEKVVTKVEESKETEKEETRSEKLKEEKETKEVKETKEEKPEEAKEESKGFFSKVKQSLTTKTISENKFEDLFWELEIALLENNVSVEVIEKIKEDLKEELVDKPLPRDVPTKIEETLKGTLNTILTYDEIDLLERIKNKKPFVITFFGINGAGKTTSIAKLTHYLKGNGLSVVLAACDTFRAAAIQQLEEHANKLGVKIIKHDYGSDAAAVAFDAIKYAEKNKIDVVLVDTAGRLHSNTNLMAELEKIIRITNPDLKIFVGESITGNDCVEQAKKFNELVEMDGVILTKVDVDDKGGAPISISYTIKKPILFLGVGQEYKDFEVFDKNVILERLGF